MRPNSLLEALLPRTPFWRLVHHFVKRMFSTDDEQGSGNVSVGIGAVFALLASPGAFASIFLMDKYSTLLQWLRGGRFNPYRASISDEYFFVVLSMTITGLVMVLRWNRLFPDRRDFANLAVLPIPIRNVFLANFTALFGLALLFGVDVNLVSSFLFPAFVTISDGSFSAFLHIGISHWVTVFSASLFSFFSVFALVGVLMLVLPRKLFGPISLAVRLLLVVALLTEFFSNMFLQLFAARVPSHSAAYIRLLPSFWFLGVYERIAGLASPAMAALGHRATEALFATIVIAVVAYALCYRRHFLRLAESLDVLGSTRHRFRVPMPEPIARVLFRSPFDRACTSFIVRVITRSERHLLFIGGYLGVGLVIVAGSVSNPAHLALHRAIPSAGILALPLTVAFFIATGLHFAFAMPAALHANWIFRVTATEPQPSPRFIIRKLMLFATVSWELLLLPPLTARQTGWPLAFEHTAFTVGLTLLLVQFLTLGYRKIPFTCSSQPETRQIVITFLRGLLTLFILIPLLAALEHWVLFDPARLAVVPLVAAAGWYALHRHAHDGLPGDDALTFEERPPSAFELLKLA